jgi:hypothetical protein
MENTIPVYFMKFGVDGTDNFFLDGERRYGHGVSFNVYRDILIAFIGLVVPRLPFFWGATGNSPFLIFGKWRFEFELSAGQRASMILFEH